MKTQINTLLALMIMLSASLILSCGDDDPGDPRQPVIETLTSSGWSLANGGSILFNNNDISNQYTGLTAAFSVGNTNTYTTTNSGGPNGQNQLFSASGTWDWADATTTDMINLDDATKGTLTILVLSETRFQFRFRQNSNSGSAAGIEGLAGDYNITLTR